VHEGSFDDLDQMFGGLGAEVAQRAIGVKWPIRENYLVGRFDTSDSTPHRITPGADLTHLGWRSGQG
jgi:hypothetical protein